MIAFDTSFVTVLVNRSAPVRLDPATGKPVEDLPERIAHMLETLSQQKETILIPTPVLAEVLVLADSDAPMLLDKLGKSGRIVIGSFDQRAAVELAAMTREAIAKGGKGGKRDGNEYPYQKVKIDRQIIAIARVYAASAIYTDDDKMAAYAKRLGHAVTMFSNLPFPPKSEQRRLL